jgi:hypothetical protein
MFLGAANTLSGWTTKESGFTCWLEQKICPYRLRAPMQFLPRYHGVVRN